MPPLCRDNRLKYRRSVLGVMLLVMLESGDGCRRKSGVRAIYHVVSWTRDTHDDHKSPPPAANVGQGNDNMHPFLPEAYTFLLFL